jgi:hypothetical protein
VDCERIVKGEGFSDGTGDLHLALDARTAQERARM